MVKSWAMVVWAIALCLVAVGCAARISTSAGGHPVPRPFPMPDAPRNPASSGDASVASADVDAVLPIDAYELVGTALQLRGTEYRDGGADPKGFDCSGFTQYVFSRHGLPLPRAVRDQFSSGRPVDPAGIEAGDLLFFTTTAPGASHVAIAVSGDEFVHAPSSAGVVRVERLSARYWAQRFLGARRVL